MNFNTEPIQSEGNLNLGLLLSSMRATRGGFTKVAKHVLEFEWRGISVEDPMAGDLPRRRSQPELRRSNPSVTCPTSYEFLDCSWILASA